MFSYTRLTFVGSVEAVQQSTSLRELRMSGHAIGLRYRASSLIYVVMLGNCVGCASVDDMLFSISLFYTGGQRQWGRCCRLTVCFISLQVGEFMTFWFLDAPPIYWCVYYLSEITPHILYLQLGIGNLEMRLLCCL